MYLNLLIDGASTEVVSESELYSFAHGPLCHILEKKLSEADFQDDLQIDNLAIDLEIDPCDNILEQITENLQIELKSKIDSTIFSKKSTPITNMLVDIYLQHAITGKACDLEKHFAEIAYQWYQEHQYQGFNSFALAAKIIDEMQEKFPNVNVPQTTHAVYQKILQSQKTAKTGQVSSPSINQAEQFVADSGIILLSPYIPVLFERTGCLEKGKFLTDEAKFKAISVLNFAAFGSFSEPPRNAAVMNILSERPASPVYNKEELPQISDSEKDIIEGLLKAVIANWKAVGHMSPDGLRASYFIRPGKIKVSENDCTLIIENKTFDILLDKLPWGYSVIKLPWMKKTLNVKWR